MEKKALKYIIILLVVPLIISLIIGLSSGGNSDGIGDNFNSLEGNTKYDNDEYEKRIQGNSTYIYLSVFAFVLIGAGVWIYVKKKGDL